MSQIMHLRKECLLCGTIVHAKQSLCAFGHIITLKMIVVLTADNQKELVKCRTAMESVEKT